MTSELAAIEYVNELCCYTVTSKAYQLAKVERLVT